MGDIKNVVGVINFGGKEYVEFNPFQQLADEKFRENKKLRTEIDLLEKECAEFKRQSFRDRDNLEKFQKDFAEVDEKNKALEDENNALKAENSILKRELEKEKQTYIKMDENFLWIKTSQAAVMWENTELKLEIQRLREKCGEVPKESCGDYSCDQKSNDEVDLKALVYELQDQHQQDCIRINDLTTTISVLSSLYTNLRRNMGID